MKTEQQKKEQRQSRQRIYASAEAKEVRNRRSKDWYYANKERHNAGHLAWVAKNKDKRKQYIKNWKIKNPEKVKQLKLEYYNRHKDRLNRERRLKRQEKNRVINQTRNVSTGA